MKNRTPDLLTDEVFDTLGEVYDLPDDDPYMGLWSEAYDEILVQSEEDRVAHTNALGRFVMRTLA